MQKINQLTFELLYSYDRWDGGEEMNAVFKKTVFENLLADYHTFKVLTEAFSNFISNLVFQLSSTNLFLHLNIDSFVDANLPLTNWKSANIKDSIKELSEKRKILLDEIENFLSNENLENKIVITRTLVSWFNTVKRINQKFFIGRIKNINSDSLKSTKEMEINYFFSTDIFRTFQNFISQKSEPNKRILILSPYVNYLSIALWLEGYEITQVSNNFSKLQAIEFSNSQFKDLINQNIYLPSQNFKDSLFNVLYDEEFLLKRFNDLENKSYIACILNFLFSSTSKVDSNKILFQLNKIKSLMKPNSMVLIQEDSVIENLLDEMFTNLEIQVILKVRFIEHTEITNWLLTVNKIK